jgi:hypothetical protein
MNDIHLTADAVVAVLMWIFTTGMAELVIKPTWRRLYRRIDQAAGDRLPNLK